MNPIYYHVFVDPDAFRLSEVDIAFGLVALAIIFVGAVGIYIVDWFNNRKP